MKLNGSFFLRFAVSVILIAHSIPGMFDGGVNNFGTLFLDQVGFAPMGIFIAWTIKLSHVAAAVALMIKRYVKLAVIGSIFVFAMGIYLVHMQHGWYVVGGGSNGIEFNFLLIFTLLAIGFPNGFGKGK